MASRRHIKYFRNGLSLIIFSNFSSLDELSDLAVQTMGLLALNNNCVASTDTVKASVQNQSLV